MSDRRRFAWGLIQSNSWFREQLTLIQAEPVRPLMQSVQSFADSVYDISHCVDRSLRKAKDMRARLSQKGVSLNNVTDDEIASLFLFATPGAEIESSLSCVLNQDLNDNRSQETIQPSLALTKILCSAICKLSKIPEFSVANQIIYRGVKWRFPTPRSPNPEVYFKGSAELVWPFFASFSRNADVVPCTDGQWTLFRLTVPRGGVAINLAPFSPFPHELEVIIPPLHPLILSEVHNGGGLTVDCVAMTLSQTMDIGDFGGAWSGTGVCPGPPCEPQRQGILEIPVVEIKKADLGTKNAPEDGPLITTIVHETKDGAKVESTISREMRTHLAPETVDARGTAPSANVQPPTSYVITAPAITPVNSQGKTASMNARDTTTPVDARQGSNSMSAEELIALLRGHKGISSVCDAVCRSLCGVAAASESHGEIRSLGGIEEVIDALRVHHASESVCEQACRMLHYFSRGSDEDRSQICKAGGVEAFISALRIHCNVASVAEAACWNLRCLACDTDSRVAIRAAGGPTAILSALTAHLGNIDVCRASLRAICNIACDDSENCAAILSAGGLGSLCAAIRTHPASPAVCEAACLSLHSIARTDPGSRSLICSSGCIELLINALQIHLAVPRVCILLCRVLRGISESSDVSREAIRAANGIAAVISVLRSHANDAAVCQAACRALRSIARTDACRNDIGAAGGIEAIVSTLRTFKALASVCESGCLALGNIALHNAANRNAVGSAGGIEEVVSVWRTHHAAPRVCEASCWALGSFSENDEANRAAILSAGGHELLVSSSRKHLASAGMCETACWALSSLVSNGSPATQATIDLVVAALRVHTADAAVRDAACRTLLDLAGNPLNYPALRAAGGTGLMLTSLSLKPVDGIEDGEQWGLIGTAMNDPSHRDDWEVRVAMAVSALRMHAGAAEVCEGACLTISAAGAASSTCRELLVAQGGLETISEVLRAGHASAVMCQRGCELLCLCAGTDDGCTAVRTAGGIEAASVSLRLHISDTGVCTAACGVLIKLSSLNGEGCRAALRGGAVESVVEALREHSAEERVVGAACLALCAFAYSGDNRAAARSAGAFELVKAALDRHPKDAGVRLAVCRALGSLGCVQIQDETPNSSEPAHPGPMKTGSPTCDSSDGESSLSSEEASTTG